MLDSVDSIEFIRKLSSAERPYAKDRPRHIDFPDRIAVDIRTAGATNTKARLGIYKNGTNLYPGSLLLDAGAKVSIKCNGRPALIASVLNNDVKMAELLLTNGANANEIYEHTPLYFAYKRDNVQMGKVLLKHGADPSLEYNGGKIPKSFIEQLKE